MRAWAFLLSSSLMLLPLRARADDCAAGCADTCSGSIGNKLAYQACMKACIARCPDPPPAPCNVAAGAVFPRYYVLGLVYAPPGCTSTATMRCGAQSSVDYSAGSTMGSKVTGDESFSADDKYTLSAGFKVPDVASFSESLDFGTSASSTDSTSVTISKSSTLDIKLSGSGDGVDHDQDMFLVLLNPAIAIRALQPGAGGGCGPWELSWYAGLSGSGTEVWYELYVAWLKDPSKMPRSVAAQLESLGFTAADYQAILSLDPFAAGPAPVDPTRYVVTALTFPYEPPLQLVDCSGGVCSCASISETIKNELLATVTRGYKTSYTVGASATAGFDFQGFTVGGSQSESWTWTSGASAGDTTDSSQSATVSVSCPSAAYTGPTRISVYWDTLFGSFLFVPYAQTSTQLVALLSGKVLDDTGSAVRHVDVTLSAGGRKYRSRTGNDGSYLLLAAAGTPVPASGSVTANGVTVSTTLGPARSVNIAPSHVPRPDGPGCHHAAASSLALIAGVLLASKPRRRG